MERQGIVWDKGNGIERGNSIVNSTKEALQMILFCWVTMAPLTTRTVRAHQVRKEKKNMKI